MTNYRFEFLGEPKPKLRPKFCRRGKFSTTYTPKETREAEQDLRTQVISQLPPGFKPLEGAIRLEIRVRKRKPKSARKKDIFPTKRPDLDNYLKLILDALNTVVFVDDSQIIDIKIRKDYDEQPGVTMWVEEIEV